MRRVISMLLAVMMVVSLLPTTLIATHALSWNKVTSIAVGDEVVLATDADNQELSGFSTGSTPYGTVAEFSGTPAGTVVLTVAEGASEGTYVFEIDGAYLYWVSGKNSLSTTTDLTKATSWNVSFDDEGNAIIVVASTAGDEKPRQLQYNTKNPRFACYTSVQTAVQLYALGEGCTHANAYEVEALDATCTEDGYTAGTYCPDCSTYLGGHETIDKLGHKNEAVVTPPTVTEQGYTTYTCTVCGSSYKGNYTDALGENYTVSFVVPNGAAAIDSMVFNTSGVELPVAGVPASFVGYEFAGWAASSVATTTEKPELYTGEFYNEGDITLYAVYTIRIGGSESTDYKLTDITKIPADAIVVITMTDAEGNVYALSSANGSSKAPAAITVTVADGVLSGEPADELKWNIVAVDGGYMIYPNGITEKWLYATNTNNGVRVGTGSANVFSVEGDYFMNTTHSRYVGVYLTTPDWRAYTNTTGNTKNQVLGLYAQFSGGKVYYTSVGDEIEVCQHTETTTDRVEATCTEDGYENIICASCGEVISETVLKAAGHSYVDGVCSACGEKDPTIVPEDVAQILADAYALAEGESLLYVPTLTGEIISIDTEYSEQYSNITVTIVVNGDTEKPIKCYRLAGEGADALKVGDVITVTGSIKNYYGTIEFTQGCTLDAVQSGEPACEHEYFYACDAHCMICGELTNENAAHAVTAVEAKAATCTENGNVAYWYCEYCGSCWTDEALTQQTNGKNVVIPAGHTYKDDCDAECNVCGETRNAPHSITYVEGVVPANCQEEGWDEYWYCTACKACFGDAEASWQVNPAWLYYTGEHVRPEGAIPCAVVACTICGEDDYGESCDRGDAPVCQDAPCINCGEIVWGWGCNYNTGDEETPLPLCQPGTCVYCGTEYEKLYDCENGSWAPCTYDGECAYGCGKQYPATGEHEVDDPCAGGTCWLCWNEIEPAHEYTYACDAHCAVCGELTNEDAAHSVTAVEAKDATCYENGNIAYWTCESCGGCWADEALTQPTNVKNVVVPMGHGEIIHVEAKAATCAEYGNVEYWYCEDCGQPWLDAECIKNTNQKSVILPMEEHEYFYACDAYCMNCGELTNEDADHSIIHVEAVAATCGNYGNVEYWTCESCGSCWLDENLFRLTNMRSVTTYLDHNYIDGVCEHCGDVLVNDIKWQVNAGATANDESVSLRLISFVDSLANYSKVEFVVCFYDDNGDYRETTLTCTTVYEALNADGQIYTVDQIFSQEDANYIVTYTINGWPNVYFDNDIFVYVNRYDLNGELVSTADRVINLASEM